MAADGAIKDLLADTARGTPMECPPPSTRETVGLDMEAISSAIPRPASMSPPTVLSSTSRPSTSSLSSMAASRGMTCSYLVVLAEEGRTWWPSICPTMVRVWMVPRSVRMVEEPISTICCWRWSPPSSLPVSAACFVSSMPIPSQNVVWIQYEPAGAILCNRRSAPYSGSRSSQHPGPAVPSWFIGR